jgi:hypothetical protein
MYCASCEVRTEFICYIDESGQPLWYSGQSPWLENGDVFCFLWGTNWIYLCYIEESRPPCKNFIFVLHTHCWRVKYWKSTFSWGRKFVYYDSKKNHGCLHAGELSQQRASALSLCHLWISELLFKLFFIKPTKLLRRMSDFQVMMASEIKSCFMWSIRSCSLEKISRRFGATKLRSCIVHAHAGFLFPSHYFSHYGCDMFLCYVAQFCQASRHCYIPEDPFLHNILYENIKYYNFFKYIYIYFCRKGSILSFKSYTLIPSYFFISWCPIH